MSSALDAQAPKRNHTVEPAHEVGVRLSRLGVVARAAACNHIVGRVAAGVIESIQAVVDECPVVDRAMCGELARFSRPTRPHLTGQWFVLCRWRQPTVVTALLGQVSEFLLGRIKRQAAPQRTLTVGSKAMPACSDAKGLGGPPGLPTSQ